MTDAASLRVRAKFRLHHAILIDHLVGAPDERVHGEFVNYAAIGIWNRPRQWCRQA